MLSSGTGITPYPSSDLFADNTNIRLKKPVWLYGHTGYSFLPLGRSLDLFYSQHQNSLTKLNLVEEVDATFGAGLRLDLPALTETVTYA